MVEVPLPTHSQNSEKDYSNTPIIVPSEDIIMFDSLGLSKHIMQAVDEMGYKIPTQIQAQAIPIILAKRDLVGIAQTGTGKTASFTLPIVEILSKTKGRARMPRALILEPTRELAVQVAENLKQYSKYAKIPYALLVGGESMVDQKEILNRGVDIIIATPGRLLDLFEKGAILLNQVQILVIDEADRMLDMGFIPDVEKIISFLPKTRQTLLLSATQTPEIKKLMDTFLTNPKEVTVSRPSSVATTIETGLIIVPERQKGAALRKLLKKDDVKNAIIFCNRKRDVDTLTRSLNRYGFQSSPLHGDLAQHHRTETMENFKNGRIQFLVCSDIAARGIDVENLSHVFNYDLPRQAEDYVHRIGRTGRAGRVGYAYSFATPNEQDLVKAIEELTKTPIPVIELDEPVIPAHAPVIVKEEVKSEEQTPDLPQRKRQQNSRNQNKTNPRNDNIVAWAPVAQTLPEDNTPVIGFGQFIPTFMLSPFRNK